MGILQSIFCKDESQRPQQETLSQRRYIYEQQRKAEVIEINRQHQQRYIEEHNRRAREILAFRRKESEYLRIGQSESECLQPEKLLTNLNLVRTLVTQCNYQGDVNYNNGVTYNSIILSVQDVEYRHVSQIFRKSNKKCYTIDRISKVTNPYLMTQYKLKKMEYKQKYGRYEEMELFHGTKLANIDSICKNNFDWRLKGSAKGHIFGQGVSFSPISYYATNYGDCNSINKVMILAMVLVGQICDGNPNMYIPPLGYDTSAKGDRHVVVKYEDNTFYPAFVIYYSGVDMTSKKNNGTRRKNFSHGYTSCY